MKIDTALTACGNGFIYILSAVQTNELFQIIELIIAIITSIVLLAYRIWKWWREVKEDGKISAEEIKKGIEIVSYGVNEIKETIEKKGDDSDGL